MAWSEETILAANARTPGAKDKKKRKNRTWKWTRSGHQEGDMVRIAKGYRRNGIKQGRIHETSPSGKFHGVEARVYDDITGKSKIKHIGYFHESDLGRKVPKDLPKKK